MKKITFTASRADEGFDILVTGIDISVIDFFLIQEVFYQHTEADTAFSNFIYEFEDLVFTNTHIWPTSIKENSFSFRVVTIIATDIVLVNNFLESLTKFYKKELVDISNHYHNQLTV